MHPKFIQEKKIPIIYTPLTVHKISSKLPMRYKSNGSCKRNWGWEESIWETDGLFDMEQNFNFNDQRIAFHFLKEIRKIIWFALKEETERKYDKVRIWEYNKS